MRSVYTVRIISVIIRHVSCTCIPTHILVYIYIYITHIRLVDYPRGMQYI